jgi:hypothetical protein
MDARSKAQNRTLRVDVVFQDLGKGEDLPPSRAYLFDRAGKLVESQAIAKDPVTFPVDPEQRYQVMVGPDLLRDTKQPPADLAAQLAQAKVVRQDVIPQLKQDALRFALSKFVWFCWWETCITVHGTVRKVLNPGDPNPQYATICNGTVQIFQVDLGCTLDQLASFQVLTLREVIVDRLRGLEIAAEKVAIIHGPVPPGPLAEAIAVGAASARLRHSSIKMEAAASRSAASARAETLSRIAPTAMQSMRAASLTEAATTIASLEGVAFKQYVVANRALLWWLLCELIPDWAFCWQELGEVPIQSDGSFWAEICFWCPADFPDLYFEVIQNVGGTEREISDPQIACSTYYNYDGSQSVDIVVDDPAAVACLPDPGRPIPGNDLYVWPTAIGNVDLRYITDVEGNPAISTPATGLVSGTTPWGGSLSLQLVFDPRLKALSNVRYYRWSYKFDGDPNFTQIGATVTHRYMTVTYLPLMIHLNPVTLGPQPPVGGQTNLFQVPDPFPGDGWVDINDPYDRPFGYFDSTDKNLPPFTGNDTLPRRSGLCTLMLEMFDNAGTLVPCSNLGGPGPFKFVLPDLTTPGQYTSVLTSNNITPQGQLTFRVRVDNNDTVALLTGVTTPTGSADPCGILHYSNVNDLVSVHYTATHPNNFLTWGLSISRGLVGTVASAGGSTSSPPMSLPAPSTPGEFKNPASALLGGCTNAAFAVNLDVDATATDGYSRQDQYDRDATIAFALITP